MSHSPDLIAAAFKMILVFGILLGILVVALYFAKKALGRKHLSSKGTPIRVLSEGYLGVKKRVALVQIPGSVLVLGITNEQISLLDKIDDDDVLTDIAASGNESIGWSFLDHIQKLTSHYKGNKVS